MARRPLATTPRRGRRGLTAQAASMGALRADGPVEGLALDGRDTDDRFLRPSVVAPGGWTDRNRSCFALSSRPCPGATSSDTWHLGTGRHRSRSHSCPAPSELTQAADDEQTDHRCRQQGSGSRTCTLVCWPSNYGDDMRAVTVPDLHPGDSVRAYKIYSGHSMGLEESEITGIRYCFY